MERMGIKLVLILALLCLLINSSHAQIGLSDLVYRGPIHTDYVKVVSAVLDTVANTLTITWEKYSTTNIVQFDDYIGSSSEQNEEWRDTYGIVDGKLKLIKHEDSYYVPVLDTIPQVIIQRWERRFK